MDAALDGLRAGRSYSVVIHRLGDLTRGAESTGEPFDAAPSAASRGDEEQQRRGGAPTGFLGTATADAAGRIVINGAVPRLQVGKPQPAPGAPRLLSVRALPLWHARPRRYGR